MLLDMVNLSECYEVRIASCEDAEVIASHRSCMFRDMGLLTEAEAQTLFAAAVPWIAGLLEEGKYVGWLVVAGDEVVAGGGLHLSEVGPVPGCLRVGRLAHFANVYTEPAHRRLGVARMLMMKMMEWAQVNGIDQLTLSASDEARKLYGSFGFVVGGDLMRLRLG